MIEAGSNTFTLNLHPRLTVIAGVGQLERESLVGELIGALGSSRAGVHLEVVEDDGRHLAVFRPVGARHRVVDIDAAADVSREYVSADGKIDLLGRAGLEMRQARRRMRLTASDLTSGSRGDELVHKLAAVDQAKLWAAAERVLATDDRLQLEAEAVGSAPEDAAIVDRIEQRHQEFEAAQAKHESVRHHSIFIAGACAVAGVPAAFLNRMAGLGFVGVALVTWLTSIVYRRRLETAREAEQVALAEAGAQSYLGFHLQRVNGLLSSDQSRRRLMGAAEGHREAVAAWREIAGAIPVDWAMEHQEEIVAAARVRTDMDALGNLSATAPEVSNDQTTGLAHVLITRLAELRSLGDGGESFPLVLDDPFVGLEPSVKPSLLELLGRSAGTPQVIFLTQDEDVASWARLEALTGELSILEPTPEQEPAKGHIVAA